MNYTQILPEGWKEEVSSRIGRIRAKMQQQGLQAILIGSNANIYYTAGRYFRGYVYIDSSREKALYLVIRPNNLTGDEMAYIRKPEMITEVLAERGYPLPGCIGLEYSNLTYSDVERLKKVFPGAEYRDCTSLIADVRMVKTPFELKLMKEDGEHQAAGYSKVVSLFREGMTDVELQIELERVLRQEGALGYYRTAGNLMELNMGTVLAGANADAPGPYDFAVGGGGIDASLPAGANGSILRPGTTVSIDMNGAFNGYQTDMTRVWCVGRIDEEARRAHECSRRILRELERIGTPGTEVKLLYEKAMEIVKEEKLEDYFMGHAQKAAFIGHGVGIELNERPVVMARSRDVLEENMTIALEPKFVIPHTGPVGVENTYRVTEEGLVTLTRFPEEIQEL